MASNIMTGSNADLAFLINGVRQAQSFRIKTWSVTPTVTKFMDSFGGDPKDHPDQQVRSYAISVEMYKYDAALEKALMAREIAREACQPIPELAVVVTFRNRDGSVDVMIAGEVEFPPPDTKMTGAAERLMNSMEGTASTYGPAVGL